jgi:GDP-L-fucose synthase
MNILITGASGFLGTHLSHALRSLGHSVTELNSRLADLRDADSLQPYSIEAYDQIYHIAAWTQAGDFCLTHAGEQWIINQQMNTTVLNWWKEHQPQAKLIAIGSSCCYEPGSLHIEQNFLNGMPIDSLFTYAMTKRMLYTGLLALHKQFGLKYLFAVPSTLYGPDYHLDGRQMHFIFDLMRKIAAGKYHGEPVTLWGDGSQHRELIHVRDFVRALITLAGSIDNEIVNIGGGEEHSIKYFADMLCGVIGYDPKLIQYDTAKYVGAKSKVLDISKFRELLPDFRHSDLEAGLRETVSWYLRASGMQSEDAAPPPAAAMAEARKKIHQFLDQAATAIQQDDSCGALESISKAQRLGVRVSDLNYLLGLCRMKQGDNSGAIQALEDELRWYPDNVAAAELLGRLRSEGNTRSSEAQSLPHMRRFASSAGIHQFITTYSPDSNAGAIVQLVRRALLDWGFDSCIFAEGGDPECSGEWQWFEQHRARQSAKNIALYYLSDSRSPLLPYLRQTPDRRLLYYRFPSTGEIAAGPEDRTANARQNAEKFRTTFYGVLCDTAHIAAFFRDHSYEMVEILPPAVTPIFLEAYNDDSAVTSRLKDGKTNVLVVGTLMPDTGVEESIRAFRLYQKEQNRHSRLILAGALSGAEDYLKSLHRLIEELEATDVLLTGYVTRRQLAAYYRAADVLLALNEPNDSGLSLVQAMQSALPVIAADRAAAREILGEKARLLGANDGRSAAEALHQYVADPRIRSEIIASQQSIAKNFSEARFRERLATIVERVLSL